MKKFITKAALSLALATLLGALAAGCGSAETETEETAQESAAETGTETAAEAETQDYGPEAYLNGINAADYVTLGEYKGIEVSVDAAVVTDEYLQSYIDYVLQSNMVKTEITDRPVEEGDIVNIDYEGKIDGVAFDGGTAQGYDLTIGSGTFIDGFEDGLIGAQSGETLDVNVTFPENYQGKEVAGKDAVFTVTVNSISVESLPELTDEFVQGLELDVQTVEEFRQYAYDLLMEEEQATRDANAEAAVLEAVMANAQLQDPPEDMTNRYYSRMIDNMTYYASIYGYDLESFLSMQGMSEDSVRESSADAGREIITMQAIADAEGLQVTDEELDAEIESNAASLGYEDAEEYRASLDVEGYREYMMSEKVLAFLLDNAVVTDNEPETAAEAAGTESAETETAETESTEP
ncbi:MAG TPA: trigger factor [Candidatus Eisenbergiella merdavium]|uniref:peptidylprolyl isomerase n=2 Tax=Eisenbergiella TaxID=1432051 RepID=A0A9D2MUR0_9FIRM|nr:trigger factor [Candidatus Eisenbergiella merdigallinarum]HJC22310.1 trigger factor [Candidatus Eisenbergiella merdavium]